jgi:dipeptidyl-peptidase 4
VVDVDQPGEPDGSDTVTLAIDHDRWPYVTQVSWAGPYEVLVCVQSRDQREVAVLSGDARTGATTVIAADADPQWVELVSGVPARLGDGRLVCVADRDGVRRLLVDDAAVTPTDLQVRSVIAVSQDQVMLQANPVERPERLGIWRWHITRGLETVIDEAGVNTGVVGGNTVVVRSTSLDHDGARFAVMDGPAITSYAELPTLHPTPALRRVTPDALPAAVLLPRDHDGSRLPVLLDPYGGPHAQRVVASRAAYLTSQWFADQGFAVVVIDGAGTPGRGSAWERAVHCDLATRVLDDQVRGLQALADEFDVFDLDRVAIRGWSFGGYLAALAVLQRPDVFHAAIAGAPVTEWRWYDTHYTERYLGDPGADSAPYDASSLLPLASKLERPLLLIHGLADDNVVAAHTLQLSNALLAAGRPHEVLPLSGVSHMTPQEVVAENLLRHQLAFLRRSLA